MSRISVLGMVHEKNKLLSKLMELGTVELRSLTEDSDLINHFDFQAESELKQKLDTLFGAITVLFPHDDRKKPMFKVRREISKNEYLHIVMKRHEVLKKASVVNNIKETNTNTKNEINRLNNLINSLNPWKNLNVSMDNLGTSTCNIYLGTIPAIADINAISAQFKDTHLYMETVSSDNDQYYVLACVHKEFEKDLVMALRKNGFSPVSFEVNEGYVKDIIENNRVKIERLSEKLKETEQDLSENVQYLHEIETVYDYYTIRKELLYADEEIKTSKRIFVMEGWIPEEISEKTAEEIKNNFTAEVLLSPPQEGDEVPVLVKNGPISESVEDITKMFSMPSANEADPNRIMAPFFILFFGLMLSDGGYGLILALSCAYLYFRVKMERTTKRFIKLMMFCGIATMFWGALFGSWFGNLIPILSNNIDRRMFLWFDPISDPEYMLMWVLLFGVIHIFCGLGVRGYNLIKHKKYLDALFDVVFWYIFFIGAIFTVMPYVPAVNQEMAQSLVPAGTILLALGALLLLLTQGRSKKGFFGKFLGGLSSMYDLVGFMGDILSYSRLLAMGLATSVIATIVNNMGSARGFDILGILIFILVFAIGHGFNFALNALGAYVHSSRLQYIEFFSKFYKGGGKAFRPFKRDTKYVNIKD